MTAPLFDNPFNSPTDSLSIEAQSEAQQRFWRDFRSVFGLSFVAALLAVMGFSQRWVDLSHLGAEYFCIARSLDRGEGFSNPFSQPTGPTAWMPPVLPYLESALMKVVGQRGGLVFVVMLLQLTVVSATGAWLIGEATRLGSPRLGWLLVVVFGYAGYHDLFCVTHDSFLILAVMQLIVVGLQRIRTGTASLVQTAMWGLLGGFAALTSPAAGFAWAVMTTACWIRASRTQLLLAAAVSMVVIAPWMIRNYRVFGAFVPIKSNAGFDAWQANVDDADGLIDVENFKKHPWLNEGIHRDGVRRLGEVAYSRSLGQQFRVWVAANPMQYVRKVWNRGLSATICFRTPDQHANQHLLLRVVLFAVPWIGMVVVLLRRTRNPISPDFVIATGLMLAYLLPYILITYYDRYGAPLVGLKAYVTLIAFSRNQNHLDDSTL